MKNIQDTESLRQAIHSLLQALSSQRLSPPTLLDDFLLVRKDNSAGSSHHVATKIILDMLEILDIQDLIASKILRWRFLENETLIRVAHRLNVSEFTVSRQQRAAIEQLTILLQEQESALQVLYKERLKARLPPPTYTRLFGLDDSRELLEESLLRDSDPAVIILVGIGDIGKTALANVVTQSIIQKFHFEGIHWLRQEIPTMSGEALSHRHFLDGVLSDLADWLDIRSMNLPIGHQKKSQITPPCACSRTAPNGSIAPFPRRLPGQMSAQSALGAGHASGAGVIGCPAAGTDLCRCVSRTGTRPGHF